MNHEIDGRYLTIYESHLIGDHFSIEEAISISQSETGHSHGYFIFLSDSYIIATPRLLDDEEQSITVYNMEEPTADLIDKTAVSHIAHMTDTQKYKNLFEGNEEYKIFISRCIATLLYHTLD